MEKAKKMALWLLLLFTFFAVVSFFAKAGSDEPMRPMRSITVYTTLPAEYVRLLASAYEKQHSVRVDFVPLTGAEILERLDRQAKNPSQGSEAILALADIETLERGRIMNYFVPHLSEKTDAVKENFKDKDGFWTGVWYDPTVFAFNRDFVLHTPWVPNSWRALAERDDLRIGLTDFLAADAAGGLLFAMIGEFGETETYKILGGIHPKVVSYAKFLANPPRQAGMGEVDVSVALMSETLRYMENGYPLKIVYPSDGTFALITAFAIPKGQPDGQQRYAKAFADWLLSDAVANISEENGFFFMPTSPMGLAYKRYVGKNLKLFSRHVDFTAGQKKSYLDRWVREIRFE